MDKEIIYYSGSVLYNPWSVPPALLLTDLVITIDLAGAELSFLSSRSNGFRM